MAKRYPETALLTQIYGVGTLIALTFVLTIEDAGRFAHSRDVGCYLGCSRGSGRAARVRRSGDQQGGRRLLRRYLVQASHCICGRARRTAIYGPGG